MEKLFSCRDQLLSEFGWKFNLQGKNGTRVDGDGRAFWENLQKHAFLFVFVCFRAAGLFLCSTL